MSYPLCAFADNADVSSSPSSPISFPTTFPRALSGILPQDVFASVVSQLNLACAKHAQPSVLSSLPFLRKLKSESEAQQLRRRLSATCKAVSKQHQAHALELEAVGDEGEVWVNIHIDTSL